MTFKFYFANILCMKVVGIFGSSASGKSTIAKELTKKLDAELISMDNYYKSYDELDITRKKRIDFANPIHYDVDLLYKDIVKLKNNKMIRSPIYSFEICSRTKKTLTIKPSNFLIIEGYGLLTFEKVRNLLDISFFVDADEEIKVIRMIQRDTVTRGNSINQVIDKYYNSVLPNYYKYVLPYSKYADYKLNGNKDVLFLVKECVNVIKAIFQRKEL